MNNIYIKPTQEGWPEFIMRYPVKVKTLKGTNVDSFNQLLENDINISVTLPISDPLCPKRVLPFKFL